MAGARQASRKQSAKATPSKSIKKKSRKTSSAGTTGFDPRRFVCNVVPSVDTEQDWTFGNSLDAGIVGAPAALPPSVDLRASWWRIGNQESTGSCVGWATADGLGRYHMEKAGRITTKQLLSPRYVWMASKETDTEVSRPESFIEEAGTMLKAAADIARKYGFALEQDLPFHIPTNMFAGDENSFYASCSQRRIASYFNLKKNINNWKAWLAATGPILVALNVDAAWDNAGSTGGVIDGYDPATVRGGHAVAVVGYRTDGHFIVRNSWGTSWGDHGFGYVSPAYIAQSFFDESYGFTV
ncbi:MAG: C1 family peptidase [Acidimicrobiia bacterium]